MVEHLGCSSPEKEGKVSLLSILNKFVIFHLKLPACKMNFDIIFGSFKGSMSPLTLEGFPAHITNPLNGYVINTEFTLIKLRQTTTPNQCIPNIKFSILFSILFSMFDGRKT